MSESAPTPPQPDKPDGQEGSPGSGKPDLYTDDPYRPKTAAEAGYTGVLEETGSDGESEAEAMIVSNMYAPYIESGDMTEEEAGQQATEVIEVAGKLDDESLVAAHSDVSGLLDSMQSWEDHLDVDTDSVDRNFDALVGAYKAGDAEAVSDLRGMMGVEDQDLWNRALSNVGDRIIPEQAEAEAKAARPAQEKLLPDTDTPAPDEQAKAEERVHDLFAPENDEKFLARFKEIGEAYTTTTRVMQALPYVDFERAHHVYDMALDDPDSAPQALMGVTAGLENLTLVEGEASLPLWQKALEGVAVEAEQGGDRAFVVAYALHDTLDRLSGEIKREKQDPNADPDKIHADEGLLVKLDNLAYREAPPSLEQKQEAAKRMRHLFGEFGIDGEAQWN